MAGYIKKHYPEATLYFLGRTYTREVVNVSEHVDEFINYDELEKLNPPERVRKIKELNLDICIHVFPQKAVARLMKKAGVPTRVGTTNRWYHWLYCNTRIALSRKNSPLHEAQLNLQLLSFFIEEVHLPLSAIASYYGFTRIPELSVQMKEVLRSDKFKVILHPKSKGSAREWGLDNFNRLIALLPSKQYQVLISGTKQDAEHMQSFLAQLGPEVVDLTSRLTLKEFIAVIQHCDSLVAASTGPLHIAAALGKSAIGLYSPKRPIHPGRWGPLGTNAEALVFDEHCLRCANGQDCDCIERIEPKRIVDLLENS